MFLIRWLGIIVSLPFYWLGMAGAMFRLPPAVQLLRAAYFLSVDQAMGVTALSTMSGLLGPPAAWQQAQKWAQTRPGPDVVAYAGLAAVDQNDLATAKAYHVQSLALGRDSSGLQEMLEFFIIARGGDQKAIGELIARLSARRDLSTQVSKFLENFLLGHEMERGDYVAARNRANRLLAIEENPEVRVKLWALDLRQGDPAGAQRQLSRASLPPPRLLAMQALAMAQTGDRPATYELLNQLRQYDAQQADRIQAAIEAEAQRRQQSAQEAQL